MKYLLFSVFSFYAVTSFAQDLICYGLNEMDCEKKIETSYNKTLTSMIDSYISGDPSAKAHKNELIIETHKHIPLSLYKKYLKDCASKHADAEIALPIFHCAKQKVFNRFGGYE